MSIQNDVCWKCGDPAEAYVSLSYRGDRDHPQETHDIRLCSGCALDFLEEHTIELNRPIAGRLMHFKQGNMPIEFYYDPKEFPTEEDRVKYFGPEWRTCFDAYDLARMDAMHAESEAKS